MRPRCFAEYTIIRKATVSVTKNGLAVAMWTPDDRKERTIRHRERGVDNYTGSPWLEETEVELIEREVRNNRRFRNLGSPQKVSSKTGKERHTRS